MKQNFTSPQITPYFRKFLFLFIALSLLLTLSTCTLVKPPLLQVDDLPTFVDDGNLESLFTAIQHHKTYLQKASSTENFVFANTSYSSSHFLQALEDFEKFLTSSNNPDQIREYIKTHFYIFQAGGRGFYPSGKILVTAYYEPVLEGSLKKRYPFIYPLYKNPRSSEAIKKILPDPLWTREEIEEENHLQGLELVYLASRFDAFTLHVQGSGIIRLRDGSLRGIRYDGNNNHPYSSIGKYLVDRGKLTLEQTNMETIKTYIDNHPDEADDIYYQNKRYIFFSWGKGKNDDISHPPGSLGVPLTPQRSIAIDGSVFPYGAIGYLMTQKPVFNKSGNVLDWLPLRRFVLPQDSGAAIQGQSHIDFFWGRGSYAKQAAHLMKEEGKLYFLFPRQSK